jgi:hypothetical protein
MNRRLNIIITKISRRAAALTVIVFAGLAFAHGGFDHVMGTVAKVTGNVLTVTTVKGKVDVRLDDKTELTRGDHKAQVTDLTPGVRVVVDIPEGSKDRIAHSVKIGATAAGHDAHK